ncbi:hypothetical protein P389DRAFT_83993 [Cystobasidium minutum MCA 4210]|uniref:uncharacterized protein n=1 Tax=Cystobasidium minutum MCA 4210 TaxID=1397322 RepID=UPI0034CED5E8|eukprot:jgi/Rhomi1/83993/CE83992_973
MPLRTSAISEAERRDIEKEWDTERAFSLNKLSATRRNGLRFVKALKTDEEWTRESRAGIDSFNHKPKTSREIAEENARWYRDLVSGSSSGTVTREGSATPPAAEPANSPVASTSKVTLDDVVNKQDQSPAVHGQGSKDVPFTLEDEDEEDEEAVLPQDAEHDLRQRVTSTSSNDARHQPEDPPHMTTTDDSSAVRMGVQDEPQEILQADALADDLQDMYCLLCKTVVPASDVPGHRTTILHQLSKSSDKDSKPLIPPTYYGVRSSNVGYGMLQRLGWAEDRGLGSSELGRKTPLKASDKHDRKGLGVDSKRKIEEEEKEGKIVSKKARQTPQVAAKPLAKNRKELERAKKREMQMFKEGLAYFNS